MKLKYLGTGAAEGVPSMFCQCANCKKSRALGGRNLRTRSQALVNDELLIDFNADSYWHFIQYNIDWERVCGCIITHSHPDHFQSTPPHRFLFRQERLRYAYDGSPRH